MPKIPSFVKMDKRCWCCIIVYLVANLFNSSCGTYYTPQFAGTMQNISADKGDDVSFICHIKHVGRNKVAFLKLDPPTLLTWQHKIFATRPHKYRLENPHDGDQDKWALHILNLQEYDAGVYMCQVGTSPMITQTSYLFLRVPPRINAQKTTHDMVVMENHNATLTCAADGSPQPLISWKRNDDKVIVTNDPEGFGEAIIYKPNLTIYKISRSHMTDYMCLADNGIMPSDAWFVKVHVNFPPTLYPVEQRVVGYLNYDVKLQCKAEAWPRPEFKWFFQGRLILANNTKYQMLLNTDMPYIYETLNVLVIRALTKDDFGAFFCNAKNDYGENKVAIELIRKDYFDGGIIVKEDGYQPKVSYIDKYDGKNESPFDNIDDNVNNEIKPRQQPPPYNHQSDDRSSRRSAKSIGTSTRITSERNFHLLFVTFSLTFIVKIFC